MLGIERADRFPEPATSGSVVILFASAAAACRRVAGLPAAARMVRATALAGLERCFVVCADGGAPDAVTMRETDRLRGAMPVEWRGLGSFPAGVPVIRGEESMDDRAARAILYATRKPGDGLVSRMINRPISQAITRCLLAFDGIRPIHATCVTALIAIAMLAALLFDGEKGLIAGALLFQAASVFDGVDGEISRATFRATPAGARADALVDAATNLAFFFGLAVNLWRHGHEAAAAAGCVGLVLLALGLTLIGRRARAGDEPFSFDVVKRLVLARGSRIGRWLTWLTMRDSFALLFVLVILAGFAAPALGLFAAATAAWLGVVIVTLRRQAP